MQSYYNSFVTVFILPHTLGLAVISDICFIKINMYFHLSFIHPCRLWINPLVRSVRNEQMQ